MKKICIFLILLTCFTAQLILAEDWFEPKSVSDLKGFWECSLKIPIAKDTIPGFPESAIAIEISIDNTAPSGRDQKVKFTIKFDLNNFMDDIANLPEMRATGFTKDTLWAIMSESFTEGMDEIEMLIGKYFFSIIQTYDVNEFFFEDTNQIFINSSKTKLLLVSDEDISQGLSDTGVYEVIFTKK